MKNASYLNGKKREPYRFSFWRRHPDSDWGVADLQSTALPLGYGAIVAYWA